MSYLREQKKKKKKSEGLSIFTKDPMLRSKGKVVPVLLTEHHAMEAYWGSGGTAPLILWPLH
jgi:hypothetical protein